MSTIIEEDTSNVDEFCTVRKQISHSFTTLVRIYRGTTRNTVRM